MCLSKEPRIPGLNIHFPAPALTVQVVIKVEPTIERGAASDHEMVFERTCGDSSRNGRDDVPEK